MKALHTPKLYSWSSLDETRNIDFNGTLWQSRTGNVVFDPMPLTAHNQKRLQELGGADYVIISNSDHIRAAEAVCKLTGAQLCAPVAEQAIFRERLPELTDSAIWLGEGDEPMDGLKVFELHGSKTLGELAFLIEGHTLLCGDLIRAHSANTLMILPDGKLNDKASAIHSLSKLAEIQTIEHVLVGDGWPIFNRGHQALQELFSKVA